MKARTVAPVVALIGGVAAFLVMRRYAKLHPDPSAETPHP